jgi:hypothetical protein
MTLKIYPVVLELVRGLAPVLPKLKARTLRSGEGLPGEAGFEAFHFSEPLLRMLGGETKRKGIRAKRDVASPYARGRVGTRRRPGNLPPSVPTRAS